MQAEGQPNYGSFFSCRKLQSRTPAGFDIGMQRYAGRRSPFAAGEEPELAGAGLTFPDLSPSRSFILSPGTRHAAIGKFNTPALSAGSPIYPGHH
jgi:hypothetical protein